jgi:hypothetical protein
MVKFSVNNGKSLPVTVPTVARVHWYDLAAIADPNVRVKTVHGAVITIGASKPTADGSSACYFERITLAAAATSRARAAGTSRASRRPTPEASAPIATGPPSRPE